jgi:XTP/dITP diphosphohydrolase
MKLTNNTPTFITGNAGKVREFEQILGFKLNTEKINLTEIQSTNVSEVTKYKVQQAFELLKKPVIVEDTGLYIDDINGFPGALIKFYMRDIGCAGISAYHKLSTARAETVIGYHNGTEIKLYKGVINGKIANEPRGSNGFGWDMIFIPDGKRQTFAEMTDYEKNAVSMRKLALNKLKQDLTNDLEN